MGASTSRVTSEELAILMSGISGALSSGPAVCPRALGAGTGARL